jgi:signal peptidase I
LPSPWRTIVDWGVTIAIAVGAVLLIKEFVVNPYRIPSSSMEPTFHCARPAPGCESDSNERVLANRFLYRFQDPERGEIVVFNPPEGVVEACGAGGTYVKRIIGLPGETISQRNGIVFVNGSELAEPYLEEGRRGGPDFGPVTLGDDEYWMMGDNRGLSCDSRRWGPVERSELIGPVFLTYWPLSEIGFS